MKTDHTKARPGCGFYSAKPYVRRLARPFTRRNRSFLVSVLLGAAALSWGCSGFVAGQNTTNAPPPTTYTISGTISPSAGGGGATVTLSGAGSGTTTANSSGAYSFTGLANGTYTVTPSHSGYTYSPASQNATVNGADVTGLNFTATAQTNTFSISGTITPTAGGSGATVTLSGAATATTTANSSGAYTFTGLANGTYAVTPSLTGYTFSPSSQNATVNGANVTGINFTATAQTNTFSISGTITPTAGGSGATVALSGPAAATTTTNASGNYTFAGLANGTYTVTPSNTGYTFSPVNQSVTVNGANQTGVNFTATALQTHTVALSWTASTSVVSGYNVYRSTTSGTGYVRVNPSLVGVLTYTDATVQSGTTYFYVTTAVDASGNESVYSNEASAPIP
jgi:carboxypeptidase family protein